jgi:UDP-glucose 4-epimerase
VPLTPDADATELIDIAPPRQLQGVTAPADTVFHLAARAEVVIPFDAIPDLNATNVAGTVNVLRAYTPRRFIFASSSAVYGNGARPHVDTAWSNVNPLGIYGMSKAAGELTCADWAREKSGTAIMFRLGNVIGARCRGLIPHLVRHARSHPAGTVPVRMRGEGRITRDYVPVEHVTEIFKRASLREWPAGAAFVFPAVPAYQIELGNSYYLLFVKKFTRTSFERIYCNYNVFMTSAQFF